MRGFARLRKGGRGSPILYAHRYSYELHIGPVPDGLTLDHVKARGCTHRHCVNPAHLEPVTSRENTLRGAAPTVALHLSGKCSRGHERTPENTQRKADGRIAYCIPCRQARRRSREGLAAPGR